MRRRRIEQADQLWDFAVAHPEGFTWADARAEFPWAEQRVTFYSVVRVLRTGIASEDSINLVCDPQGKGLLWRYRLVGTYEAALPWNANRLADTEARLETVLSVSRSIVAATDGRSVEGRKARVIHKAVGRLVEDLQELAL